MTASPARSLPNALVPLAVIVALTIGGCGNSTDPSSDIGAWLRASAGSEVTDELLACTESAANELLTDDDVEVWLGRDPEAITVEELQALPKAIAVADRCRHLLTPVDP